MHAINVMLLLPHLWVLALCFLVGSFLCPTHKLKTEFCTNIIQCELERWLHQLETRCSAWTEVQEGIVLLSRTSRSNEYTGSKKWDTTV